LYEALAEGTGHTVLLKASWLRKRAKMWSKETSSETAFLRRQDLPVEAIMTLQELRRIRDANTSQQFIMQSDISLWRLPIVAVSYCWLSPSDPDPYGEQLRSIGAELDRALSAKSKVDVKGAARADWGKAEMSVFEDVGVFVDYFSMDQKQRTEEEGKRFNRALYAVNSWYNHPCITVLLLMGLPAWYTSVESNKAYMERGWPVFEKSISTMSKRSSPLWWDALVRLPPSEGRLIDPPLTPEDFSLMISDTSKISFTNGSDAGVVKELYRTSLVASLSGADRLAYTDLGWSDADVSTLVESFVPPLCCSVIKMHLDGNAITDKGVETLCTAARGSGVLPNLTHLFLDKNQISDAGVDDIVACLCETADGKPKNMPKLQNLLISENQIGPDGRAKLEALVSSGRLKKCTL